MRAGLLGERLGHSYSPQIHAFFGDYSYDLFEVAPEKLDSFMRGDDFDALNVTIPYKRAVMPYCAQLTDAARKIGSVNTLVRRADGTLLGDNTDAAGFTAMLRRLNVDPAGKKALVLGSGGASLTVRYVLSALGAREVIVVSRKGENNYQNLDRHADAELMVNATPVGMFPNCGISPVDLKTLPNLSAVLDIIYNPARTRLLMDAEALGIPCLGGLTMLVEQARAAAERFLGASISEELARQAHAAVLRDTQNIVLIGMPGCGKSTLAAALARLTGREAVDADELIARECGTSIPEYFAEHSEDEFRGVETAVLSKICARSGLIIATGGGCVTRPENRDILRQNGKVFYIRRDLKLLPTANRPLSQAAPLEEMFARRAPLYQAFADTEIENGDTVEIVAGKIWEVFNEITCD